MTRSTRIHGSALIGDAVQLGADVTVGPNAVLLGPLTIGDRVWIGPGAVIGTPPEIASLPQNAAWGGDIMHHGVIIEDDVVIRELATVGQGSHVPTRIGRGSWLLNTSYVAHDVQLGQNVTLSSGARIGGHAVIGDNVTLGLNASVHQRRVIGGGAMIGMGATVSRDILPFSKAYGSPARRHGLNSYLLRKLGAGDDVVAVLESRFEEREPAFADLVDDPHVGPILAEWISRSIETPSTARIA